MQGKAQNWRRRQGPSPDWSDRTEMGEVAGRDREMAETHVRDGGGAWEQGLERRSHGSSL